jgi:hypothetical protein
LVLSESFVADVQYHRPVGNVARLVRARNNDWSSKSFDRDTIDGAGRRRVHGTCIVGVIVVVLVDGGAWADAIATRPRMMTRMRDYKV